MPKRTCDDTFDGRNVEKPSASPANEPGPVDMGQTPSDDIEPSTGNDGNGAGKGRKRFCGKGRKDGGGSGAPRDNRNNMRHGLKAGKLPVGCQYIENRLNAFRRQLEDLVLQAKGEVNLCDAAYIQTAAKWERHASLAERWLRLEGESLKPIERITFSREIARASTERDKALGALNLDAKPAAPWLADAITMSPADDDKNRDLEDK